MMSNMMFGGGGGGGAAQGRQQGNTPRSGTPKPALQQGKPPAAAGEQAPTAMDLD